VVFGLALAGACACSKPASRPKDAGVGAGGGVAGAGAGGSAGSAQPFVVDPRFPSCVHPGVTKTCTSGWCRIPAGCFVMGSPETEPARGANTEQQAAVTLTHAFEISATEVTMQQWRAVGFADPIFPANDPYKTCEDPSCPVLTTSWFDALAYANALSERAGLPPCYVLAQCRGVPGGSPDTPGGAQGTVLSCDSVSTTTPTVYDCSGYRLPNGAEWEFAARAGTTTAYYTGAQSADRVAGGCYAETNLLPIAWFCSNATDQRVHPVGLKAPNAWGLYDVLGNALEWMSETHDGLSVPNPSTDPYGALSTTMSSNIRGEGATSWPDILRVAQIADGGHHDRGSGFRLLRTLPASK
jgi:formylglycine-generating enzyme required for sulfatase activity